MFEDYHMAYLKTDVLLLADIFGIFRKTCMSYHKPDPADYLSAPALAWVSMLLQTVVEGDLMSDLEMLNMIERMKHAS